MYKIFIKKTKESNLFLKEILSKYNIDDEIIYNIYGKPYIKNNPIYFNLSHSGDYTAIVISDKEIGVDLQKVKNKYHLKEKICHKDELSIINNNDDLIKLWTKKEAYLKWKGTGLSHNLNEINTVNDRYITTIKIRKDYYLSIYNK